MPDAKDDPAFLYFPTNYRWSATNGYRCRSRKSYSTPSAANKKC